MPHPARDCATRSAVRLVPGAAGVPLAPEVVIHTVMVVVGVPHAPVRVRRVPMDAVPVLVVQVLVLLVVQILVQWRVARIVVVVQEIVRAVVMVAVKGTAVHIVLPIAILVVQAVAGVQGARVHSHLVAVVTIVRDPVQAVVELVQDAAE